MITPVRAAQMLAANTANRPLSRSTVRAFAEAVRRGDWLVTHQGIAFDSAGVLVDDPHRLAAIVEADLPVEVTVFTDVEPDTFDVLDTGNPSARLTACWSRPGIATAVARHLRQYARILDHGHLGAPRTHQSIGG